MIRLAGIRKSFGKDEVLKGISLEAGKGEVVAIIGPSGSGKSTLLRCVNFLERPDAGEIRISDLHVDCRKASRKDIHALRLKTAMVFQQYNLFRHKTALENVMEGLVVVRKLPKDKARERGVRLLEKVGLGDKLDAYPSRLSGGQQQRVGIARALIGNPPVILADEPTGSLDSENERSLLAFIRELNLKDGVTFLIITHDEQVASIGHRKLVLRDGRLVGEKPDLPYADGHAERQSQRQGGDFV